MHGYYGDVYWYMVAKEKYTGAWLLWRRILVHGFYGEVYWRMVAMEMYTGTWLLWRCILQHCCYGDVDWCMVAMKTNDGMTKDMGKDAGRVAMETHAGTRVPMVMHNDGARVVMGILVSR